MIQSGITLTVGLQQVLNFSLRPSQLAAQVEVSGEPLGVQVTNASVSAGGQLESSSFDQLIYLQPGVNVGRNTLIGPGIAKIDFSVTKNFPITEAKRLQVRAECFNLANHPNFQALPTTTGGSSTHKWSQPPWGALQRPRPALVRFSLD